MVEAVKRIWAMIYSDLREDALSFTGIAQAWRPF